MINDKQAFNRRALLKFGTLVAGSSGLLVPAYALAQDDNKTVTADTQFGTVRGQLHHDVAVFKGIPYGADTGGANRFKPARDPQAWTGTRDAFSYGPAAPQTSPAAERQQDGNESEDCLVLNVWSRGISEAGKPDGKKRPVMFWCHGGGFRSLSGSSPLYDGTNLCLRGDVVVVTINHRLNVMGFTHLAQFGDEYAESGNVGMLDIVHALKWVKNNIENFGGDPNRVMIFGESGGGRKVATLLAMPAAKGLFHAAVIQSGATLKVHEPDAANKVAEALLQELSISKANLKKIHDLPVGDIISAYLKVARSGGAMGFQPVRDGNVLPYHPFYPEASPVNPEVPVIVGANRTEMTYFAREQDFDLSEAEMRSRVKNLVGDDNVARVIEVYRKSNPEASPTELYHLIFSDESYVMASITIAERRAALKAAPVYLYYFQWPSPVEGGRRMTPHSLEIAFAFDNLPAHPMASTSDDAKQLADKMSATWMAFARSGNPNAGTFPQWKPYSDDQRATLVIDSETKLVNDPLAARREIMQPIVKL